MTHYIHCVNELQTQTLHSQYMVDRLVVSLCDTLHSLCELVADTQTLHSQYMLDRLVVPLCE